VLLDLEEMEEKELVRLRGRDPQRAREERQNGRTGGSDRGTPGVSPDE